MYVHVCAHVLHLFDPDKGCLHSCLVCDEKSSFSLLYLVHSGIPRPIRESLRYAKHSPSWAVALHILYVRMIIFAFECMFECLYVCVEGGFEGVLNLGSGPRVKERVCFSRVEERDIEYAREVGVEKDAAESKGVY